MRGVPRSPYKDSKYNEGSNDSGERSAANRVFPILTIPHSVLPMDIEGERGRPRDSSRFPSPRPVHENMIRESGTRFSPRDKHKEFARRSCSKQSWSVTMIHLEVIALQGRA
jgi:hypothetical protein